MRVSTASCEGERGRGDPLQHPHANAGARVMGAGLLTQPITGAETATAESSPRSFPSRASPLLSDLSHRQHPRYRAGERRLPARLEAAAMLG